MSIRVAIKHHTKYTYNKPITVYPQTVRLKPAPHTRTPIVSYALNIEPKNHFINWQQDPFGNYFARIVFQDLVKEFVIDVDLVVDLVTFNPFDFFLEDYAENMPFVYEEQLKKELSPYLEIRESGDLFMELKEESIKLLNQHTVDFLVHLNQLVTNKINYTIRLEPGIQTCEETLGKALGSCRDSAWVLVQLLRHFGLASRFVSGYIVQLTPDEKVPDGPNGPDQDFTDLHAWAEVYIPGAGWIGLDATSGLFAGEGHIPLSATPDPVSAAPVTGYTSPATATMEYSNAVTRIDEIPRVTKPYTNDQIEHIKNLGETVDKLLISGDVRLTMGGEPTFVSTEDMQSKQWNEDADGEEKRVKAYELTQRLKTAFAQNGLIHCGQGKWYPGEPIPRWQYSIYWRKDGIPIWNNAKLLANPHKEGNCTINTLEDFVNKVCSGLGLSKSYINSAYEDAIFYLWEHGNLPSNIQLKDINEEDSLTRKTLAEILNVQDPDQPTGFVLPIRWDFNSSSWQSSPWKTRRSKLYLIPGNSDIGYRLPLDRLDFHKPSTSESFIPASPLEPVKDLKENYSQNRSSDEPEFIIKTALCFQIKNGQPTIFLPPLDSIEPFLSLMTQLESIANEMNLPIMIEGYQPPFDKRIEKLVVAPDPGVIEVNIHPSKSWSELVNIYDILFGATFETKLGTQKFMLDGKHTGTGGGNHITLGGIKPEDSPLLRRPDLLRSMLSFWINHPGMSYLFSSPFIGMTSQAPRLDEGKPDAIYNLEIAFKELDKQTDIPFWLVDRLFRNILTDITGNTHRAEFCIDKLYSPDSNTGRLGILELRGFDMPPHKDMLLVQLLLVRGLVASFWQSPYRQKLTKWGSQLHDRFMTHHYVKKDMMEVVEHLQHHGIAFDMNWLEPFLEFRFPILGELSIDGIKLKLRTGIEPWNVLGEEMSSSGTARFVDSSMERVEVLISGFNTNRYHLLCNNVIAPLSDTDIAMTYVTSIRYKAWAPPSAMHPTHGVDTPLRFDIYDRWNQISIGGFTYHVMHPGGRNYETYPVNAFEAEGRRHTRFTEENHAPQKLVTIENQLNSSNNSERFIQPIRGKQIIQQPISAPINMEYPLTLDLQSSS